MGAINFILAHKAEILAGMFFLSEALSLIPSIKANGVFQAIFNFLKQNKPAQVEE